MEGQDLPPLLHPVVDDMYPCGDDSGHGVSQVHAIGDRAVELVLDSLEKAGVTGTDHRPLVTHCQVRHHRQLATLPCLIKAPFSSQPVSSSLPPPLVTSLEPEA